MKIMIEDFDQIGGNHCQTAALRSILQYHKLDVSEEMLLGLGGGIGFIYWYMKKMPAPFVGGRYGGKDEEFLTNICERIGGSARLFQTSSVKKGHKKLKEILRKGEPVYIFADMAYLPYMAVPEDAHFGAHTVAVFGIDEENDTVYIADRGARPVKVTIQDLKNARNSKFPPFPPKNKILEIECPAEVTVEKLSEGITRAIGESCTAMLHPPIKNLGLAGMKKWATMVTKWPQQFKGLNLYGCLMNVFIYIEIGGSGGSAFRPMYAQFLRESSSIVDNPALREAADMFEESGRVWSDIAEAAFPDEWPVFKRARELMVKKNTLFEEQAPGALQKMLKINEELEELMREGARELQEKDVSSLFTSLQEKILHLHKTESKAVEFLNKTITSS